MNVLPVGRRAVLVELGGLVAVHRFSRALEEQRPDTVEEVVAGAATVLVLFAEGAGEPLEEIRSLPDPRGPLPSPAPRTVSIPVVYDGPDLPFVAEAAGVAATDVAHLHSEPVYTVGFLGFSPGFAYLFGGDPRLAVARLPSPRTSVPAGSVGLAGDMTAVYPQDTPGGWRLIGRTEAVMFDPERDQPALLAAGDRVRFRPVATAGPPPRRPSASRPSAPLGRDSVEVLDPGASLTIQDRGRRGWAHAGVPVAGAADRGSAARANHLVGNPPDLALLECTLGGCRLRLRADRTVAVTGAVADITVDGLPARRHAGLVLRAGSELAVGPCREGVRVYVAISGGLDIYEVLGSRSTDTLSGLGPPPLVAGDVVPLGRPGPMTRPVEAPQATPISTSGGVVTVRARAGPRWDWLGASGLTALEEAEFTVTASSDRTGLRLEGPLIPLRREGEIPSEGMVAGAVQLPPGGGPIVLMRNHPPTGGYPVVAVVDDEGVDALAQAAPGQRVRLSLESERSAPGRTR